MKKIIFLSLLLFLAATPALAHRVIVFAWAEKGEIHIEGSFGAGRPAKGCKIQVKTPEGTLVHQGITDQKGTYSFTLVLPTNSDLIVHLNAGTGHAGQWTLKEKELRTAPEGETSTNLLSNNQAVTLEAKTAEKQALEQSPSLARILAGIALIFGLVSGVAWIKKRQGRSHDV